MELDAAQGRVGILNQGNTCYLNAAVQCLSNVPLLREYILTQRFKEELNPENKDGSKKCGVALAFFDLVGRLWHCA